MSPPGSVQSPFPAERQGFPGPVQGAPGLWWYTASSPGSASANPWPVFIHGSPLLGPAPRQHSGFNESTKVKIGVFFYF